MNDLMTKSFLNYAELKKQAMRDHQLEDLSDTTTTTTTTQESNDEQINNLSTFFQEVETVKSQMGEVTTLLKSLESLNQETKTTTTNYNLSNLREIRNQTDTTTLSILHQVKSIKTQIESFDKSNIKTRKKFGQGSTVDRTRTAITNGLRFRLKDLMSNFGRLRDRIADDHREMMKRKYQEVNDGELPSEETVEKLVSSSLEAETMMAAAAGCDEMKERSEVVIDIRRSLGRLQQVFLDMAVLIEAQQDQVDDIESNVVSAGEYISGGTNSLYYAKQMKPERKCGYLVVAVVMCVLLVCIISTLAT